MRNRRGGEVQDVILSEKIFLTSVRPLLQDCPDSCPVEGGGSRDKGPEAPPYANLYLYSEVLH